MRAAQAAKDHCKGELVDNFLQATLPVLKTVIDELCCLEPNQRSALLALSLLECCNAPADLLAGIRSWASAHPTNGLAQPPKLPAEPRSSGSFSLSPKQKIHRDSLHSLSSASIPETDAVEGANIPEWHQAPEEEVVPKKKQSVLWRRNLQLSDNVEPELTASFSDDEDNDVVPPPRMISPKRSPKRRSMRKSPSGAMGRDRPRRFTVSLSSKQLGMPARSETLKLLKNVSAFAELNDQDLNKIADVAICNKFEVDENIVVQGAPADHLHIVIEGQGRVCNLAQFATVGKGDVIGEDALRLSACTNPQQVSAAGGSLTTLSVAASAFQLLDITKPSMTKRGKGLEAKKNYKDGRTSPTRKDQNACEDSGRPILKDVRPTPEEVECIKLAVVNNKMLGEVLQLSTEQCELIAASVHAIRLDTGEILFSKGDNAYAFYIIRDGLMDVLLDGKTSTGIHFQSGSSFGELALLYDSPRSATLKCVKECTLWVLPRNAFKQVACLSLNQRIKEYSELIGKIPAISRTFGSENLDMLADAIEEVTILQGDFLCEEGDDVGQIFVIYKGECEMETEDQVIRLSRGDWVGEEQVLRGSAASFTVKAVSAEVTALVLDYGGLKTATFAQKKIKKATHICSPENPLCKESFADHLLQDSVARAASAEVALKDGPKVNITSMVRLGVLGEGSFGRVLLLKDSETSQMHALKALGKQQISEANMAQHVTNERQVMSVLDSDFIVRLYASYQDDTYIYFLLEPVMGGELFDVYSEMGFFGSQVHARFYIACITLALEHMHSKRVIYRDLKLENCLLDAKGYCKLTDLGISKMVLGKTYTICGTADYFAPETLKQTGHNRAVDWWAVGVLLFIMSVGRSPFDAEDVTEIYKNIIKGFSKVKFPHTVTSDLSDVIKSLCRKKPEDRVTMLKGGIETFKEMPWFSSLSWEEVTNRTLTAPYIPPPFSLEQIASKKLSRDFDFVASKLQVFNSGMEAVYESETQSNRQVS